MCTDTRYERETIERDGLLFRVYTDYDDCSDAPWENDCIYDGVVSDWRSNGYYGEPRKAPHERILCRDRHSFRTFDVRRFIALAVSHGCTPQQAHEQLEPCFQRLRLWCEDYWHYIGVIVECWTVDEDGDPQEMIYDDSIWGIESDDDGYIKETYTDMIDGMLHQYHAERQEAAELAARCIVTV